MTLLDENWQVVLSLFPSNWKQLAKETGAMIRKFRNFSSEDAVLRTLLIHIAQGYSLRETVVKAKAAGIAEVSDVALLKRLRSSEAWLKALCEQLFKEREVVRLRNDSPIKMRLVDASNVKEPGKTGSLWRIHYSLTLPDLGCDYFKLTPTQGEKTAESYQQFPVDEGDCIIGDRGYSTVSGVEYLTDLKAFVLMRVNTGSLKFFTKTGRAMSLLSKVQQLTTAHHTKEWPVWLKKQGGQLMAGRICAIRKSEHAIEKALKRLQQEASKKQRVSKPETQEYAKYVIVFTTLPKKEFSARSVLEWYRLRRQIELIFKRLKSLAGLGHLPKYDEASSRAWLYGKLLVGLLVEKLMIQASAISPWGYCLELETNQK